MTEIKQLRSYNSEIINGKIVIHSNFIHYNNKFLLGDGESGFRKIDYTLLWDETRQGWYFEYNNFQPFIPRFADQKAEFRDVFQDKDQTIFYVPQCQHIEGRLITKENLQFEHLDSETNVNCIIYDNAFSEGVDLIYCFERAGMKKLTRYRKGFFPKQDVQLSFKVLPTLNFHRANDKLELKAFNEFELSEQENTELLRRKSQGIENVAYKLDQTRNKTFDTGKFSFIGIDKNDGKEWYTILKPFRIWEQSDKINAKRDIVNVDFVNHNNSTYLVKNIPASFFEGVENDVFTDSTTWSWFATNDTGVYNSGSTGSYTWAQIVSGTGSLCDTDGGYNRIICQNESSVWYCIRGLLTFAASSLPTGFVCVGGRIGLYGKVSTHSEQDLSASVFLCSNYGTVDPSDFTKISNTRASDTSISAPSINLSGYNIFELNASGIASIVDGSNFFGIRDTAFDASSTAPGAATTNYIGFWTSATAGVDHDPYLSLDFTITVTFDSQGGSAVSNQNVNYDALVSQPSDPTRSGYIFSGWYKESGCTNSWNFALDTVTTGTTIYAKWTLIPYTVTFDKNGGNTEASPTTRTAYYNETVVLPSPPTRVGYILSSWNTAANGSGTTFTSSTLVTASITVYAQWTTSSYPNTIDSFTTYIDDVDTITASTVNDCHDVLTVIESTLGANPQGSMTDLKTRLSIAINDDGTLKPTGLATLKSGATQVAAGAAVGELWKTSGHATLPNNVIMIGV